MTETSPTGKILKKFFGDPLPATGFACLGFFLLTSLLGYAIMPDDSPSANQMHIELSVKKPGTVVTFLRIKAEKHVRKVSFLEKMLFGQPAFFYYIPISHWQVRGDSIEISRYTGLEGDSGSISRFHVFEVAADGGHMDRTTLMAEIKEKYLVRKRYVLGTDKYGRDMLSRMILGSRVSLSVGLMAVLISLVVGVILGSIAGFFGGWVDALISWLISVVWSLPALLLVIAISFALGKGFWQVFVAVGISMWVEVARMVRGQILGLKEVEFIEATKALGYSHARTIIKHILPNITGPILVVASSNFASAILLEASLSFLGFGVQPPFPSWGSMIKENYGYITINAAFLAIIPGVAIMIVVYAFNVISIGLGDAYNVKAQNSNV